MAKKIKFALKMKDGVEVRNLQELRDNFDLNQVTAHFMDGKLETWLSDRYYDEEAEQIESLQKDDSELQKKLCQIFGVEYEEDTMTPEEIEARNRKLAKLKEITDDEEILANVDHVAFSQEELSDLLDEGVDTIYLCGNDFYIPTRKGNITYIGVESKLTLTSEQLMTYAKNNIRFVNLIDSDEYESMGREGSGKSAYMNRDCVKQGENERVRTEIRRIKDILQPYMEAEYGVSVWHPIYSTITSSSMFYSRDDIHTRQAAVKKAEEKVKEDYQLAENCLKAYGKGNFSEQAVRLFMKHIKGDAIEINNLIHNLNEEVKKKNDIIIRNIEELVDLERIENKAEEVATEELDDGFYNLRPLYDYTEDIVYTEMEHDPPGLFGKQDYWFDASKPYCDITDTLNEKAEIYSGMVSNQFKSQIVKPILDLVNRIGI